MALSMKDKKGMGCLILFATPFALVGLFMTGWACKSLFEAVSMRSWVPAQARIEDTDLEVNTGSDSTTYRVTAAYAYSYGGRTFQGNRVGIDQSADNIGSYHQRMHDKLSEHLQTGEPYTCYVNPKDPAQAVLDRTPRLAIMGMKLAFGLVFGGVGFGLMIGSIVASKSVAKENALQRKSPDKPWLWKEDWAQGILTSSNRGKMIGAIVFAFFWNGISWPICILLPQALNEGDSKLPLIILIFPAVGILLAVYAVRSVIRWKRYGQCLFEMKSVPGVLGGTLEGIIRVPVQLRSQDGFAVTLSCIRNEEFGSERHKRERVLWQEERVIAEEMEDGDWTQTSVPVLFALPYDGEETDTEAEESVEWRLEMKASVPGVDFATQFEVPVFRTEQSVPGFELEEKEARQQAPRVSPDRKLAESGLVIQTLPTGGKRFHFPAGRYNKVALGLTAFLAIWTGAIALMLHLGAPLLFPIVFGVFELLLIWGVMDLWFGTNTVVVDRGVVTAKHAILGTGTTKIVDYQDVAEIKPVQGMQAGNKLYYNVQLLTMGGGKVTVARNLPSQGEAEAFIQQMEEAMYAGDR